MALLLTSRPEASVADAAAMHLGAVGVSLYLAAPPATHAYALEDTAARVLVTEQALAAQVPGLLRACPALEHVMSVDGWRRTCARWTRSRALRASTSRRRGRRCGPAIP